MPKLRPMNAKPQDTAPQGVTDSSVQETLPPAASPPAAETTGRQADPDAGDTPEDILPSDVGATQPAADQDDVLEALADAIREARANKSDQSRQDSVVHALASLKVKDYPEMAENPAFAKFLEDYYKAQEKRTNRRPGEVINKGSIAENMVPWTLKDLKSPPTGWHEPDPLPPGHTQWVFDQTPERNLVVIVNGMKWNFFRDVPYNGPKLFWDQYMEVRRAERSAEQHAAWMLRVEGAAAPSDTTIITPASAGVRAHATKGTYYPGMGTQGMRAPAPEGGDTGTAEAEAVAVAAT